MVTVQMICRDGSRRKFLKETFSTSTSAHVSVSGNFRDGLRNLEKSHSDILIVSMDAEQALDDTWIKRLRRAYDLQQGEIALLLIVADPTGQSAELQQFLDSNETLIQDILFIRDEIPGYLLHHFLLKNIHFLRYRRSNTILRQVNESLSVSQPQSDKADTDILPPFSLNLGYSNAMQRTIDKLNRAADTKLPVFIIYSQGNDPQRAAYYIHSMSDRNKEAFRTVKLRPSNPRLQEAILFGKRTENPSFDPSPEFLSLQQKGTLYIENLQNLDWELQGRMMQWLQWQEMRPDNDKPAVIFSVPENVQAYVHEGTLRQELYYRIHSFPVRIPPLSERSEDIIFLIDQYAQWISRKLGREMVLSAFLKEGLSRKAWPGNEKELFRFLYRLITTAESNRIDIFHLAGFIPEIAREIAAEEKSPGYTNPPAREQGNLFSPPPKALTLEDVEKEHILRVFEESRRNISQTARLLNISRKTLYEKIRKYLPDELPGKSAG